MSSLVWIETRQICLAVISSCNLPSTSWNEAHKGIKLKIYLNRRFSLTVLSLTPTLSYPHRTSRYSLTAGLLAVHGSYLLYT